MNKSHVSRTACENITVLKRSEGGIADKIALREWV